MPDLQDFTCQCQCQMMSCTWPCTFNSYILGRDVGRGRVTGAVQDGTWAGQQEQVAAARHFNVRIAIYQAGQPCWVIQTPDSAQVLCSPCCKLACIQRAAAKQPKPWRGTTAISGRWLWLYVMERS